MAKTALLFLLLALVALSFTPGIYAFGAGNIPSFSYLEDKAFRHGDIEDIIANLFKAAGGGFLSRGTKFTPLDVKRVYFGNWLRDYSQAVDVGSLKKTNLQTIINIVMVLGFMAHGYATGEFEVTKERLGCYLPTEHIDNPKGYADGEDARQYDRRLRGPVDPRELEIDPRTGMKNYIANENGGWATSKALVRQRLQECIHYGRQYRSSNNKSDLYEAFQLLGRALHTLEDFTAHSNWCELALISFGYTNVFPHVGQNVKVRASNGRDVYPLVTGTFGGADFIHSLMGEATDHLSQASVSDLSKQMTNARSISEGQSNSADTLRQLFFSIPGGEGDSMTRDMEGIQNMRAGQPGGVDPSTMSPQELHQTIWQILSFRDSVMKKIENTIDRIPGLSGLVEKISNSVSVFIITTLEPFVKPLLSTATEALGQSSQAVIDSHDQYEVWNDWNASDPTHSFLSKDHFGLILNQPAGEIARIVVEHTVNLVVKAWDDNSINPSQVTESSLEVLFHPDFASGHSQIQKQMLDKMREWINGTGSDKNEILHRLTADMVKQGKNRRIGDTSATTGHVHNQLLPEGGLQQVIAQQNVHVPGASVLNAGQDLMSGKMPWEQGFGSGGPNAWRDINPSNPNAPSGGYNPPTSYYPQPSYNSQSFHTPEPFHSGQPSYTSNSQAPPMPQSYPPPPHQNYNSQPSYGNQGGGTDYPGQQYHHGGSGNRQPPHHGGYGTPPQGEYGAPYGGPHGGPSHGGPPHGGPPHGGPHHQPHGGPYQPPYGQQPSYGGQPQNQWEQRPSYQGPPGGW
ncbi:heterokaryon incompatibility protein HET-C [Cryptococcus deuterogattii LA55]|nr:heterokaryon incompatibility protein HET-C [Cryptococcus deuterogattii LA55]KIR94474.1 heterokaryon incompatibility protein HET-C [Cryptococcus deuterogattii CBS 10090]